MKYAARLLLVVAIIAIVLGGGYLVRQQQSSLETNTLVPKVATSIFPLYDIVRTVAGDDAETVLLLKPGASPHTFDPSPATLTALRGAEILFAIGHGIDAWAEPLARTTGVRFATVDREVTLREHAEEDEHNEDDDVAHEDEGEFDPHYWLAPDNAVAIARFVADELATIDPDNAERYRDRADGFVEEIRAAASEWQTLAASIGTEPLITFHDAFGYFAESFGLRIVATIEPFPGKEPTPQYLRSVQNTIAEYKVRALFLEPQLSTAAINAFANDTGVVLGTLDPIGGVAGRLTYRELITYNLETITETLSP